jgi:hypothetical protein
MFAFSFIPGCKTLSNHDHEGIKKGEKEMSKSFDTNWWFPGLL